MLLACGAGTMLDFRQGRVSHINKSSKEVTMTAGMITLAST